jgi:hypothetical protein
VATERCLESLAAVVTVYAGIKRNTWITRNCVGHDLRRT